MKLTIQIQKTDEPIIQLIEEQAKQQNTDFDEFLVHLIRAGLQKMQLQQPIYHDLDDLAGTWSNDEAKLFEQTVSDFEQIDEALWQ